MDTRKRSESERALMVYLNSFHLLSPYEEHLILASPSMKRIFNNTYPFHMFSMMELENLDFSEITIFYGGNGSGKSTLLNILACKLGAARLSGFDKGELFDRYVADCKYDMSFTHPYEIKAITSDDVFDYLLNIRSINSGVNRKKDILAQEYLEYKFGDNDNNLENYDKLKEIAEAKSRTMSRFIRDRLANNNIVEQSNGESALLFWEREIQENAIYILDEPENSLSAENQLKLKKFIEDSARFYNCQFIISTHSPFLLSIKDAKIYDLDDRPVDTKKWTNLENVRLYYEFFKEHEEEFDED